ncbi:MAG: helix-turn-helix domain-containing protein [Actinomycetota bacterium]
MKRSEIGQQECPIAQAMASIGDAWSMLIIREAFYGRDRFTDFVQHTGAQKTVVSARLKHLVETGILEREVTDELPLRHRYVLTPKGRGLRDMILVLSDWGRRWAEEEATFAVDIVHEPCGELLEPVLHCGSCGDEVEMGSTRPRAARR